MKHYIKKDILRYHYRTTKSDLEFQKRIIRYIVFGLPMFTFWSIMGINFIFWLLTGKTG